jgi:hypothetical protein
MLVRTRRSAIKHVIPILLSTQQQLLLSYSSIVFFLLAIIYILLLKSTLTLPFITFVFGNFILQSHEHKNKSTAI